MKKRKNHVLLPLLLLIWLVCQLGKIAAFLPTRLISFLQKEKKSKKLRFQLIFPKIRFHLPLSKKRRGRPRTQPLLQFWSHKFNKIFKKVFPTPLRIAIALVVVALGVSVYSLFLVHVANEIPSPEKLNSTTGPLTTEFYDRNGQLLYKLYEGKNRTLIKLEDVPQNLKHATIAIEDQNFYTHSGVDILGIARAATIYLQDRGNVQGGSTITQQLIKNTLLTPERTFSRKLKEVILAFWTERLFSKDQILQMYFNEVPYGGPAWGIEAAAETYFNKNVKNLSLAESAYLAGLPASPTTYSPYGAYPQLGKGRQKEVLRRMVEDKYITQEQAETAYSEELIINPPTTHIQAPHFVMYVRQLLAQKYGEKVVSQGGLKVTTSLDLEIQKMTENIVSEEIVGLVNLDVGNGAAMVTDARTGQILTMVGSKNYFDPNGGNFNVTTALRQPGSSIKPITYATGFKQGYSPGNILLDTPVSFRNAWENYSPVNYDGRFHGAVSIRTALGSSYNIPAVKMLAMVGIKEMIQTSQDLGITTFTNPDRYGLSLTLGGGEVKMTDMMTVYGTFSQMGIRRDLQPILKITDANGIVLEDNTIPPNSRRVISPAVAYMVTDILSDNKARTPAFGPSSLLNIPGYTVAVKTGTTDNKRDNWTFGYTPKYVVGVWVGNNDNLPMNPQLSSGITGAAPIWNKITTALVTQEPSLAFIKPIDIAVGKVDGNKDLTVTGQTPKSSVGMGRKKIKDEKSKEEKEAITFTDPFSTFVQSDQQQAPASR